ncbi:Na+/H+ antiporter NhaA [Pseudactinotalea terrae]|uniref:Na+/H+ antiporter NhaA n=1 Tax=Pseudactinotalea terrae TaxID=1743262 RepID=UPI0012E0F17E|nr:Na+/H+ antiporter NhaA [Pseudactinotalea terrae]
MPDHVRSDLPARLARWASRETTAGALLLAAAAIALLWSNSPWRGGYAALSEITVGPAAWHLDLSLSGWAADGLLAIFFFVVGVELKQEFVTGSLRRPKEAAVPVLAAVGGMALPAGIFVAVVLLLGDPSALGGWAIPTATDIAFALGVLAIFGRGLPVALRVFLLTLAVVDDLLAITVIAVFYTDSISWGPLLAALAVIGAFALVARARWARWWLLLPLALIAWALMHASGVHATIAGVLLGMCVAARPLHGEDTSRALQYEHTVRPISSVIALPVFALFSAGVNLVDGEGIAALLSEPVLPAIAIALVLGKIVGVLGVTAAVTKLTPLRLADALGIRDLLPVALLTGIGFTVSLLIAELSFPDSGHTDAATLGVLAGTAVAATLAAVSLRWDAHKVRKADMNEDGLPDADDRTIGTDGEWPETSDDR